MRLPQISNEHKAALDALQNKNRKAAANKRLREILPQKARQRQSLECPVSSATATGQPGSSQDCVLAAADCVAFGAVRDI
jgi:hypothetical protein